MQPEEATQAILNAVQPVVEGQEAGWLTVYLPTWRAASKELNLFRVPSRQPLTAVDLAHTSLQAVAVYQTAYAGDNSELRVFAQGAAAIATLVEPDEVDQFGTLLNGVLLRAMERQQFPAISEDLASDYAAGVLTVLRNDEPTTWRSLLAYNAGIWWALGHLQNIKRAKVRESSRVVTVHRFVREVWLARAAKGVLTEY